VAFGDYETEQPGCLVTAFTWLWAGSMALGILFSIGGAIYSRLHPPPPKAPAIPATEHRTPLFRRYSGTTTLTVTSQSGRTYVLDADMDGTTLERIYFPNGGWAEFDGCELEEDLTGSCEDSHGRDWQIEGE